MACFDFDMQPMSLRFSGVFREAIRRDDKDNVIRDQMNHFLMASMVQFYQESNDFRKVYVDGESDLDRATGEEADDWIYYGVEWDGTMYEY